MITPILPTYPRCDLAFTHGLGVYLYDTNGEEHLDFASGIAVNSLGHNHPYLVAALKEQADKLWHVSNMYQIPLQEKFAKRLVEASFADTVFFTNSGSEAMETSIKMARKYHSHNGNPERYKIITFTGAFHGRTLATIAAGGQDKYLDGFGPKVDGFDQVPFGDIEAVENLIDSNTAGILIEPIQGEGGVSVAEVGFINKLREICNREEILLLFDEVQCGMGRTGKLFAHEHYGITPDIMASAKALGCGFPVGACLATEEAAVGMTFGTHGSTYGGNPLAMAVGNAVLDIILANDFLANVEITSRYFKKCLDVIVDKYPNIFTEVRGMGMMRGLKSVPDNRDIMATLRREKLLVATAGDNIVRLLPPLIVSELDIDTAMTKISNVCEAYS